MLFIQKVWIETICCLACVKWYLTPTTIFFKIPYETNIIWFKMSLRSILLISCQVCNQAFLHCFLFMYPQIDQKRKNASTVFANVAFCLILPYTRHLVGVSQQGLKPRVGFSGDIQLAHFTAELAWAAFRHASLNSWNSFTQAAVEWIRFLPKCWGSHSAT